MANKNTNMILAVAVIAVCAIAIIGVGYAYTATTDNTGNDSSVKYITLTQGDNKEDYADAFDKEITCDTETKVVDNSVVTTYKLSTNQTLTDVATGKKGIALGEVEITAEKTNTKDGFIFFVTDNSTTVSTVEMTGTFYIGIQVDTVSGTTTTTGTEYYTVYDPGNTNYYTGASATSPATDSEDAAVITENSNDKAVIHVKMYYTLSENQTSKPSAKPLDNVTFTFTADAPHTSTP